jgi:trehalose-phosphatase
MPVRSPNPVARLVPMRALRQEVSVGDLFGRLGGAARRALMLDYDGTLAPFHVEPARAEPYPGVRELLSNMLSAGHTRLVVVTGRATRDLLPLLRLDPCPEIWGSHGWEPPETRGAGAAPENAHAVAPAVTELAALAAALEARGVRVETKPSGLAVHWRGVAADGRDTIRHWLEERWVASDLRSSLNWAEFDGGIELRLPGRHKGHVVDRVLGEMGPGTVAAYLGDDLTDEDAFRAIRGRGIGVLVRQEPRPTAADFQLSPPEEVLDFLARWDEASRKNGESLPGARVPQR